MPANFPEGIFGEAKGSDISATAGLMNETCSIGMTPIMRNQKGNIRMPRFKVEQGTNNSTKDGFTAFSEMRLLTGEYYGSSADLNVYGIPKVSANQSSSSEIWLINEGDGLGPAEQVNSIVAGWTVNPPLYGDTNTRLFVYWTADGYQKTGCYNLLCPGFVQVSTDIALGSIISPLSVFEGPQFVLRILIFKDPNTENWWLFVGEDNKPVGYWPKALFCTLSGHANLVHWGGSAYTPLNEKSPPMGNGHWVYEGLGTQMCFFRRIKLVGKGNIYIHVPDDDEKIRMYSNNCYYTGYFLRKSDGGYFTFGGPGGCAFG